MLLDTVRGASSSNGAPARLLDTLMDESSALPQSDGSGPQFSLKRMYVKDLSFESPASPQLFSSDWRPDLHLEVGVAHNRADESLYEVVLQLTVTAKQEDKTVLLIEVQQAGLFEVNGVDEKTMPQVLYVVCPTILFPYARETVDTLALKGSVPPLLLAPIDFQAVHNKQQESQQSSAVN